MEWVYCPICKNKTRTKNTKRYRVDKLSFVLSEV